MNLDQIRLDFLKHDHQFIMMNAEGIILESCNSLVNFSDLYQTSIYDSIPFLESFRDQIENLKEGENVEYECINMSLLERQNVYDFSFSIKKDLVVLRIMDGEKKYAHLKNLQQERNQSIITKEIREKETRMKSRFLANMSHEIRTPLNIVTGYSNLLLVSKDLSKENREFANNISIAAKNLLFLINDILDLSKIEAGYLKIEKVAFQLPKLLNNLYKVFEKQSQDKNITFEIVNKTQIPEVIKSDPIRINQILTNLLSNALKFTEKEGCITLEVAANEADQKLTLSVTDTGIGIDADKQDQIFESFTQEEDSTTRKFGGTGLGLSIVKKLADLLDGNIELQSTKGKGSTFTLTIPLIIGHESELEPSEQISGFEATAITGKKLLIAEDNRMNRMLIVKILEDAECELTIANNGQEAVDHANKMKFDAILMDVQMPVLDGLEATKQIINGSSINANTPIIAMTAHSFEEDIKRCYDAGMVGYVSKPFNLNNLFSVISKNIKSSGEELSVSNSSSEESSLSAEESILDFQFLEQLSSGNKAFIKEFFEVYVEEVSITVETLNKPLNEDRLKEIKEAVHQVKPTLEMIGLFDTKKQIELFEQNEITVESSNQLIKTIQPKIERSLEIIRRMLEQKEINI